MSCRALMFAVALCGAAIPAAHAADQSVAAPPRAPSSYYPNEYYPTGVDWTGFYVGLEVGGGWANASWTDPFSGLGNSPRSSTVLGGGVIGANWQRDAVVFGIQADFDWMDVNGSTTDAAGDVNGLSAHWLSTVTGRIGYAFNRWLVYGKGGFAFGNERDQIVTPQGLTAASGTTTQWGWTAGGGFEYALDRNWSAKLEYDFVDFTKAVNFVGPFGPVNTITGVPGAVSGGPSNSYTIQKFVGGVNYRF
jgi:outer membrane immunogenic protein